MPQTRQKLLILWLRTPDMYSGVGSWASYDGTGATRPTSGDSDQPPYSSVVDAMLDGWRVIQIPQLGHANPGQEYATAHLQFPFVLEKLVEIDND